jgi:hypothetical protein
VERIAIAAHGTAADQIIIFAQLVKLSRNMPV